MAYEKTQWQIIDTRLNFEPMHKGRTAYIQLYTFEENTDIGICNNTLHC